MSKESSSADDAVTTTAGTSSPFMYPAGKRFSVPIYRQEANFDRACDAAYQYALMHFDVDDCGHINRIIDSQRSTDSIEVEFISYRRSGHNHLYKFEIWVERNKE